MYAGQPLPVRTVVGGPISLSRPRVHFSGRTQALKRAKRNSILEALFLLHVIFNAAECHYAMILVEDSFSEWHIFSPIPKNSSYILNGLVSSCSISQTNTWSQTYKFRGGVKGG